jgi:hypothetical protein
MAPVAIARPTRTPLIVAGILAAAALAGVASWWFTR